MCVLGRAVGIVKLSFSALGWNTLDCLLALVCANFDVFGSPTPSSHHMLTPLYTACTTSAERMMPPQPPQCECFCSTVPSWEAALRVLTLALGPLVGGDGTMMMLDTGERGLSGGSCMCSGFFCVDVVIECLNVLFEEVYHC